MTQSWDPDDSDHNLGGLMGAKTFLFVVETAKHSDVCMPPSKYESEANMFSPVFVPTSNSVDAIVSEGECTNKVKSLIKEQNCDKCIWAPWRQIFLVVKRPVLHERRELLTYAEFQAAIAGAAAAALEDILKEMEK